MGGWSSAGCGWNHVRKEQAAGMPQTAGRWTAPDVAVTVVAFAVKWELGLAFLALKLWQQASGYPGSVFAFTKDKWNGLVTSVRSVMGGVGGFSVHVGMHSSGNHAFDAWRREELERIDAERRKLRAAERDFAAYRDELLHAKDREDFERFMQARGARG